MAPAVTVLLGLVVWLIYVADRLFDTCSGPAPSVESSRHGFYRHHWRGNLLAASAALVLAIWITVNFMGRGIVFGGLLLALGVCVYFALVHRRNPGKPGWLPKEALAGILFSAGTCFPVALLLPTDGLMAAPLVLFGFLCSINCAGIEHLEWTRLRASRAGRPHPSTVFLGRHLAMLSCAAALIAAAGAIFTPYHNLRPLFAALALAAGGFAALDHWSKSLSSDQFRVLMDVALFTPALFLPFLPGK